MRGTTVTADVLRARYTYDPETGHFVFRPVKGRIKLAGQRAGNAVRSGHRRLSVRRTQILEHRAAWLYVHGELPDMDIDHINGNPADNRLANLRPATRAENMWNSSSVLHAKGIKRDLKTGRFYAQLKYHGKQFRVGPWETAEQAADVYRDISRKLRGSFEATQRGAS